MDSTKLKAIAIVTIATIIAIWLGMNFATAKLETIMWVMGVSTLIMCAMLGRKVWLVLPFMATLNLSLMIPGQPSSLLIGQILVIGFCGLLFMLRQLHFKIQVTELEIWMLLLGLLVAQAYARNPVGLNILGGDSIGARPYAMFACSFVSCLLISALRVPEADLKWLVRLSIISGLINFIMLSIGYLFPRFGVWYSAVTGSQLGATGAQNNARYGAQVAGRIAFVRDIARNLALWICSFKAPIKACFHPIWAPLVILSLGFATYSGYRNEIIAVGMTYIVGIVYRGGRHSMVFAIFAAITALCILTVINLAMPLPANIQRSLSFLPGTWEEHHKKDAQTSTDWRVDMWKEALLTNYWIENKLLGDGLGMSMRDFNYIKSFDKRTLYKQTTRGGISYQQEFMMANGDYHSGPVSTIRTIGYTGLLILIIAQIRLAIHAHRQIKRTRHTQWFPLALLIGIPLIWTPVFFVAVVGSFSTASISLLTGCSMVRILENNLPLPEKVNHPPSKVL